MPDRSAQVSKRQERERVKSQALFLAYKNMGPDRTLEKLHEMCLYIGLKLAVNTIKRYSVKYGWQRQILELQSKEAEERESDVARLVDDMNKQDASLAQGMMALSQPALTLRGNISRRRPVLTFRSWRWNSRILPTLPGPHSRLNDWQGGKPRQGPRCGLQWPLRW